MAVSDRGTVSRQRSPDEDEGEEKEEEEEDRLSTARGIRRSLPRGRSVGGERMRGGWRLKIKRYLPARESRDAYIICISGIARAEQKWLRD